MASLDYFGQCCEKFDKMEARQVIEIAKQVKPENVEQFIETVKLFIDVDLGRKKGYYLELNEGHTKCRKMMY